MKKTSPGRLRREILFLASMVVIILAARSSLADHYHVPSGSMVPTLEIGDHVVVDKTAYGLRLPFTTLYLVDFDGPARGDVVVLESPEDGDVLIKRVVAIPGDRVAVRSGRILLEDEPVPLRPSEAGLVEDLGDRPHHVRLTAGGGPDFGPVTLPPDRYLVMGDNRGLSHDGRSFGPVSRSVILGRALGVWMGRDGLQWRPL